MALRVAIVTRFPEDPTAPHGGVEAVGVTLVRALSRFEDLEIHVVTQDARSDPCTTIWEGVTVHRLPRTSRKILREVTGPGRRALKRYLARLGPDVVHAHDTFGLLVKGLATPRLFTIHGFIHVDTRLSGRPFAWPRSWLWRWVELNGWAEQPHIVSISPYVRERLAGIATGVIHDIENPVAQEFFRIQRKEERAQVFSAASISPVKNTLGLVAGFAAMAGNGVDAQLRIAGAAVDSKYFNRVKDFIHSRGLTDQITLLGSLDTVRIREELAAASVFALTSLQENAPMSIAEAMAAGVPVVASNRCGMPYMVRDGESGYLVDPNDPEDIARRLRGLLEDEGLRSRMGAKSRQIAEDRFNPELIASRTRQVYLRICEGR